MTTEAAVPEYILLTQKMLDLGKADAEYRGYSWARHPTRGDIEVAFEAEDLEALKEIYQRQYC